MLVRRTDNMRVLQNRWIFKVKYAADGSIDRFKARLFIKGYLQQFGVDYPEVFSPVVRLETLRLLFSFAAAHDYEIHQLDVVTAFLNGEIVADVYIEQLEGYIVRG